MTPSAKLIRTTHLPQFGGVYFGLKNQYKIVLNIVKFFFVVYDANKNIKKIKMIVLYFVIKKNLEKSFKSGLEHETTSLSGYFFEF